VSKKWLFFVVLALIGALVGVGAGSHASSLQRCAKRCENGDPRRSTDCQKWCADGADPLEFPR